MVVLVGGWSLLVYFQYYKKHALDWMLFFQGCLVPYKEMWNINLK